MIDFTARNRDRLLREEAEAHGKTVEEYDPIENPAGDFTSRMVRELEAKREFDRLGADKYRETYGKEYDSTWLHLYGQPDTNPLTWDA